MDSPAFWRVDLPVAGRPVLIAGGSGAALGPISALIRAGAQVTVVDPAPDAAAVDLADRGGLVLHRRPATESDTRSAWLVVAVTGDDAEDRRVQEWAEAAGRFCLRPGAVAGRPDRPTAPHIANPPGSHPGADRVVTGTRDGLDHGTVDMDSTDSTDSSDGVEGVESRSRADPAGGADHADGVGREGDRAVATHGADARGGARTSKGGNSVGRVVLVGGGPGDPGLITVAGAAALQHADVVITDRLAPLALLDELRPGTTVIDVSKVPGGGPTTGQAEINRLLIAHAQQGRQVVRLKGGDPFVFGRGAEEWQACAEQGIEVRVIPGVTSAVAVPALAGIPVTHRDANQGFTVVSGHVPPGDPRCRLDYAALARSGTTLVVLMGVATLPAITAALTAAGLDPRTPAATIADGGLPGQRTVRGTVEVIAALTAAAGLRPPAITVIGAVAAFTPDG